MIFVDGVLTEYEHPKMLVVAPTVGIGAVWASTSPTFAIFTILSVFTVWVFESVGVADL